MSESSSPLDAPVDRSLGDLLGRLALGAVEGHRTLEAASGPAAASASSGVLPPTTAQVAEVRIECEVLLATERRRGVALTAALPGLFARDVIGFSRTQRSTRQHRVAMVIVSAAGAPHAAPHAEE